MKSSIHHKLQKIQSIINLQPQQQNGASFSINIKKRKLFQATTAPIQILPPTIKSLAKTNKNIPLSTANLIIQQNKKYYKPLNLLQFKPHEIKSITYPQIFMPDLQTYVNIKGNFFIIKDNKNQKKYINRKAKPFSEIIYFDVQKQHAKIILVVIEKFNEIQNKQGNQYGCSSIYEANSKENIEIYYRIHITIYNTQNSYVQQFEAIEKGYQYNPEIKNSYNVLEFKGFQFLDNNKKAFLILAHQKNTNNRANKSVNININNNINNNNNINANNINANNSNFNNNSNPNPNPNPNPKNNTYQIILINFYQNNRQFQYIDDQQHQTIRQDTSNKTIAQCQLQLKQNEQFIKIINSQFGDIVLIITNYDIYQIQTLPSKDYKSYNLITKPFSIFKMFMENKNTYYFPENIKDSANDLKKRQCLKDAHYVKRTLRLEILTSHGRIFVLQSQQYLLSQSLYQVLSHKQIIQSYNLQKFSFKKIHPLKNLVAVQIQSIRKTQSNLLKQVSHTNSILQKLNQKLKPQSITRALLIIKILNNSISLTKLINIPFEMKDYQYFKIHPFKDFFQILIQTINNKNPEILEIYNCQILSNKNHYIPFMEEHYIKQGKVRWNKIDTQCNYNYNQINGQPNLKIEKKQSVKVHQFTMLRSSPSQSSLINNNMNNMNINNNINIKASPSIFPYSIKQSKQNKVAFGKTTKTIYILQSNQLYGYRLYTSSYHKSLPFGIKHQLSVTFFQKPLKILIHPINGNLVILYKQFIKFFYNNYSELKNYYILNIRNISDICYTKNGQYLIIALNDNSIYLIDSYTFKQTKIMNFYGEIKDVHYINQKLLAVKSIKGYLYVFKLKNKYQSVTVQDGITIVNLNCNNIINSINKNNNNNQKNNIKMSQIDYYDKLYDIKLSTDSIYMIDQEKTIIIQKNGKINIYQHNNVNENQINQHQLINNNNNLIKSIHNLMIDINSKNNEGIMKNSIKGGKQTKQLIQKVDKNKNEYQHPFLTNSKMIGLQKNQYPTSLLYSPQFGIILIGTNFGNLKQCLYPFQQQQPSSNNQLIIHSQSQSLSFNILQPQISCYSYPLSNLPITHIQLSASYSQIYILTQQCQIFELKFQQFINGISRNAIFTISKNQLLLTQLKYQYAHRDYLIDNFTLIDQTIKNNIKQQYQQAKFIQEKLKDDIDDITNKIRYQSNHQIQKFIENKKQNDIIFRNQFNQITRSIKNQQKDVSNQLEIMIKQNNQKKLKLKQIYQQQLLQIYNENNKIKNIKKQKISQYQQVIQNLKLQFIQHFSEQQLKCQKQLTTLQLTYHSTSQQYHLYKQLTLQQQQSYQFQLNILRTRQLQQISLQLHSQQQKQQYNLSNISRLQKQIQKYKNRNIYFENIIVQTKLQIQQLDQQINGYQEKKIILVKSLEEKEEIIQDKQKQIIYYIQNNNNIKKIKNVHEFQLNQFQYSITPIQQKIKQMQKQIQKMNFQIQSQFEYKMTQQNLIDTTKLRLQKLKYQHKQIKQKIIQSKQIYQHFLSELTILLQNPFNPKLKKKLQQTLTNYYTRKQLGFFNTQAQKHKKQGEKLIRKKNILLKSLEQVQLKQQNVIKNKNQFFRNYQQNTNIVTQYNQLFKQYNHLILQKKRIQDKIILIRSQPSKLNTPIKRTTSLHFRRSKISQKKLTPFQKYQTQHYKQIKSLKIGTAQTRASKQDSTLFLKTLIKDFNSTTNKFQQSALVRDRIRTYVNPELSKQYQRQLFTRERERGKSNFLKI